MKLGPGWTNRPLLCSLACALALSLAGRTSTAASPLPASKEEAKSEIRVLIAKADKAFAEAHYEEAARAYLEAHTLIERFGLGSSPELLFNAGLSFERVEACDRVAELFSKYLEKKPKAATADLRFRLKRAKECAPEVDVKSNPPKAIVEIDGDPRGITPAKLNLRGGAHTLRLTLDGYEPLEASFNVKLHRPMALSYKLKPSARSGRIVLDLPAGETMIVDGTRLADGPYQGTKELSAGQHEVMLEKEGCSARLLQIKISPDAEPLKIDPKLECSATAVAVDNTPALGSREPKGAESGALASSETKTEPAAQSEPPKVETPKAEAQKAVTAVTPPSKPLPTLVIASGAVGVGGLLMGVVGAAISASHVSFRDAELAKAENVRSDATVRSEQNAAFNWAVVSYIGFGVAAAGAVGAALFYFGDKGDSVAELDVAPSGAMVRMRW